MFEIEESIELKLLLGQPVSLSGINIYSPLLKDIVSVGYDKYNHALSSLLFNKSRFPDLKDLKESNFDLFTYFYIHDEAFKDAIEMASRLMFRDEIILEVLDESPRFKVGDFFICSENFSDIQKVIKCANKVPDTSDKEEFNPANSKAKEFIDKIMGDRAKKPQKKPVSNLHSLISGLSWKSPNINILNISDLTIYQFYDGYYRLENIDHYNNIMNGIYSGKVDSTKIKIQENTWTKIIT
ncbi:hypothetical protein [Paenibacillus sp. FSL E2-0178]|uniref:hypothetical protein n=1 Tax=Paenibacillus sp. FSL E2-0178 TaxID=2921361 RepID=UPI003159683E